MFWTNTVWYLMLLLSSVIAVIVTMKKSQNPKFTIVFSLAVLGFTYFVEALLIIVLNAYTYYPMITPNDPFFDAVLGNFFSQISITTSAVLLCTLDLKSIFIFIFAFAYYLIDVLFVHLGIYVHYWYRSVYTLIGFIPLFWIIKRWYLFLTDQKPITERKKKILYTATCFFAIFAVTANTLITSQKWIGVQMFHSGLYADMSKDHTATALVYGQVLIAIFMLLRRWNPPHLVKAGVFMILFLCHYALYRIGIIIVPHWWFLFATLIDILGFYVWTVVLYRMIDKSD